MGGWAPPLLPGYMFGQVCVVVDGVVVVLGVVVVEVVDVVVVPADELELPPVAA